MEPVKLNVHSNAEHPALKLWKISIWLGRQNKQSVLVRDQTARQTVRSDLDIHVCHPQYPICQLFALKGQPCVLIQSFATQGRLLTTQRKKLLINTVGKGENAGSQHFLLFLQCFPTVWNTTLIFWITFTFSHANPFKIWTCLKLCRLVNGKIFITFTDNPLSVFSDNATDLVDNFGYTVKVALNPFNNILYKYSNKWINR